MNLEQSLDIKDTNSTAEDVAGDKKHMAAETRAKMKIAFDSKFKEAMQKKTGKNVKILHDVKYREKLERIGELGSNAGYRWLPEDYALLKGGHHIVDTINTDGSIAQTLVRVDPKTGSNRQYITVENLFDVIHANHTRKARHSGRLLTYKELALSYANITMEQVICFIDLCNTCAAKKNKIK